MFTNSATHLGRIHKMLLAAAVVGFALALPTGASAQESLTIHDAPAEWLPILDETSTVEELAPYLNASTDDMSADARSLPAVLRSWRGPDDSIAVVWIFETASAQDASDFVRRVERQGEPCPTFSIDAVVAACDSHDTGQISAAWRSGSLAGLVVTSPMSADVVRAFAEPQLARYPADSLTGPAGETTFGPLAFVGGAVVLAGLGGLIWWFSRGASRSGREGDESGSDDASASVFADDGEVDLDDA